MQNPFELGTAAARLSGPDILEALDFSAYFHMTRAPFPDGHAAILQALACDELIRKNPAGGYDITNLGAILFARRLGDFRGLWSKTARLIRYRGSGRLEAEREHEAFSGYAVGFDDLVSHVRALTPAREVIGRAYRREITMFPAEAIRELVANLLIHQDFSAKGMGPMIEVFDRRLEVTNPGELLIDAKRLVDAQPRSRNEGLANFMCRLGLCEGRGVGIDRVVAAAEGHRLPAPVFLTPPGSTRVMLFAHKPFREMDRQERLHACYMHACLRYVTDEAVTNSSLRARLGIKYRNASMVSRLLADAVDSGLIVVADPTAGPRWRSYLPFWARS